MIRDSYFIIDRIAQFYGLTRKDIISKKRTKGITEARNISIYLLKDVVRLSLHEIADIFNRDYSTIGQLLRHRSDDPDLVEIYTRIKQELRIEDFLTGLFS